MYILLVAIFSSYVHRGAKCGIPVLMWLSVHLSLFVLNSVMKLLQICVMRYCFSQRFCYNLTTSLSVNLAMIAWLVYGNIIFFSEANNCAEFEGTRGLNSMMLFFLVIGYVQFIAFLLVACVLPCLIIWIRRSVERPELDQRQIVQVANSLQR